jgi:hypothetical protein
MVTYVFENLSHIFTLHSIYFSMHYLWIPLSIFLSFFAFLHWFVETFKYLDTGSLSVSGVVSTHYNPVIGFFSNLIYNVLHTVVFEYKGVLILANIYICDWNFLFSHI